METITVIRICDHCQNSGAEIVTDEGYQLHLACHKRIILRLQEGRGKQ